MITLRPLTIWDSAFCYRLACDPVARANSFDPRTPSWWRQPWRMWRNLRDPNRSEWVILIDSDARRRHGLPEQRVGVVGAKYEPVGGYAEIGINIAREWRGRGFGRKAIEFATKDAKWLWRCSVVAQIKPGNRPSLFAFARAGYTQLLANDHVVVMRNNRKYVLHANPSHQSVGL